MWKWEPKSGIRGEKFISLILNPERGLLANQPVYGRRKIKQTPRYYPVCKRHLLVVIELKNAVDENANLKSAFNQLQTYKQTIPLRFYF